MPNGGTSKALGTILKYLGPAAPYVIIIVLLGIAFYFFREQDFHQRLTTAELAETHFTNRIMRSQQDLQDARAEAREARQEAIKTREHYESITDRQISRIGTLLDLAHQMQDSWNTKFVELGDLRREVEVQRQKAQGATLDAEHHQNALSILQEESVETKAELTTQEEDLRDGRTELSSVRRELDEAKTEGNRLGGDRANQIADLTSDLKRLAQAVTESSETPINLRELAQKILTDLTPVKLALQEYAKDERKFSKGGELRTLIGYTFAEVNSAIEEEDVRTMFKMWLNAQGDSDMIVVASSRALDVGYADLLVLHVQNERVREASFVAGPIIAVRLKNPDDWNKHMVYLINGDGEEDLLESGSEKLGETWTVQAVIELDEDTLWNFDAIVAETKAGFPILSVAKFQNVSPDVYSELREESWRIGRAIAKEERALNFEAVRIPGVEMLAEDLWDAFIDIANAAVRGEKGKVGSLVDARAGVGILGWVAAAVLGLEFEVVSVVESAEYGERAIVEGRYLDEGLEGHEEYVEFAFERDGREVGWRLTGLSVGGE